MYSDSNVATQSTENLSEARWSRNVVTGIQNSGKSVMKLALPTASIANIAGERNINTDPTLYTGIGTNPTDPVYGIFKMASVDGVTNVKAVVSFELYLDVIFKELTPQSES